jgi:hypothetical protein
MFSFPTAHGNYSRGRKMPGPICVTARAGGGSGRAAAQPKSRKLKFEPELKEVRGKVGAAGAVLGPLDAPVVRVKGRLAVDLLHAQRPP